MTTTTTTTKHQDFSRLNAVLTAVDADFQNEATWKVYNAATSDAVSTVHDATKGRYDDDCRHGGFPQLWFDTRNRAVCVNATPRKVSVFVMDGQGSKTDLLDSVWKKDLRSHHDRKTFVLRALRAYTQHHA